MAIFLQLSGGMRLRVYFRPGYPLKAIGDIAVISTTQTHNVTMNRLACSRVFADWLKRSICKESIMKRSPHISWPSTDKCAAGGFVYILQIKRDTPHKSTFEWITITVTR